MNQANVKVSFYLKKSEADANGECPVMAKLNIGKYSEAAFSVKMKVPQSRWGSAFYFAPGNRTGGHTGTVWHKKCTRAISPVRVSPPP